MRTQSTHKRGMHSRQSTNPYSGLRTSLFGLSDSDYITLARAYKLVALSIGSLVQYGMNLKLSYFTPQRCVAALQALYL